MNRPTVIRMSKTGKSVWSGVNRDMQIDTKFNMLKIKKTGTLEIDLPSETLNSSSSNHSVTYSHNLGYIPFFTPFIAGALYPDALDTGGDYIVNDIGENDIPAGAYSPPSASEFTYIKADTTDLTFEVRRANITPFDQVFGARKATLYYAVFYNKMNEEYNLL